MIEDRTGAVAMPDAFPIGAETELEGMVDLVTMEEWVVGRAKTLARPGIKAPIRDRVERSWPTNGAQT